MHACLVVGLDEQGLHRSVDHITPNKFIHEPWLMDKKPASYPDPVVNFCETRDETLEVFANLI